ncbi:MAG TPA: hypothetical protein VIS94_07835 [Desulfomonilia bacterium]
MSKLRLRIVTCLMGLVVLANSVPTFAASTTSGQSSGGSAGYANCNGSITVQQGGFWSNDSATAYTSADATGTYGVAAVVWYNDGSSEKTQYADKIVNNSTGQISVTSEAPNDYGNKGTGGHTYSSSIRGSWSGSTSQYF